MINPVDTVIYLVGLAMVLAAIVVPWAVGVYHILSWALL